MHELVVGGEILDMFEKDEVEGMIYRLAEEITENVDSEVSTNSMKELREILTKVSHPSYAHTHAHVHAHKHTEVQCHLDDSNSSNTL